MAKRFTSNMWKSINDHATDSVLRRLGLPDRRRDSVVIASFNIRELGKRAARSDESWQFLTKICERFDLIAVQEVLDDLEGVRLLRDRLTAHPRKSVGMAVSDTTGSFAGVGSADERLAFLFDWRRIERTELASDIGYDRSQVLRNLADNREPICNVAKEVEDGKSISDVTMPAFLTFIRQPHCASFRIKPKPGSDDDPIEFLCVNAHLLYGRSKKERRDEFEALISWLYTRAKQAANLYYPNFIMLGDCNYEFELSGDPAAERRKVDEFLKGINRKYLRSRRAAKVNFPLLTQHPTRGVLKTNARLDQTYDQIAIFSRDDRLPLPEANDVAGQISADDFDYGVFRFTDLFAEALHGAGATFDGLTTAQKKDIVDRCEFDVSDHMPAWFRLRVPGSS